jgi:hypothetical protein
VKLEFMFGVENASFSVFFLHSGKVLSELCRYERTSPPFFFEIILFSFQKSNTFFRNVPHFGTQNFFGLFLIPYILADAHVRLFLLFQSREREKGIVTGTKSLPRGQNVRV